MQVEELDKIWVGAWVKNDLRSGFSVICEFLEDKYKAPANESVYTQTR
jgi:hypothetical protein